MSDFTDACKPLVSNWSHLGDSIANKSCQEADGYISSLASAWGVRGSAVLILIAIAILALAYWWIKRYFSLEHKSLIAAQQAASAAEASALEAVRIRKLAQAGAIIPINYLFDAVLGSVTRDEGKKSTAETSIGLFKTFHNDNKLSEKLDRLIEAYNFIEANSRYLMPPEEVKQKESQYKQEAAQTRTDFLRAVGEYINIGKNA